MISRVMPTILAVVVVLGLGVPANAASLSRTDPVGDAPLRYDIVRTTYVNSGNLVRGVVKVPGLRTSIGNQVTLTVGPDRTDDTYFLIAKRYKAGRTSTRLVYMNVVGQRYTLPCAVRASWDFANDRVSVWTRARGPQCLNARGGIWFATEVGLPNRRAADQTTLTRVRRN